MQSLWGCSVLNIRHVPLVSLLSDIGVAHVLGPYAFQYVNEINCVSTCFCTQPFQVPYGHDISFCMPTKYWSLLLGLAWASLQRGRAATWQDPSHPYGFAPTMHTPSTMKLPVSAWPRFFPGVLFECYGGSPVIRVVSSIVGIMNNNIHHRSMAPSFNGRACIEQGFGTHLRFIENPDSISVRVSTSIEWTPGAKAKKSILTD